MQSLGYTTGAEHLVCAIGLLLPLLGSPQQQLDVASKFLLWWVKKKLKGF